MQQPRHPATRRSRECPLDSVRGCNNHVTRNSTTSILAETLGIRPGDRQSVPGESAARLREVPPKDFDAFEIGLQHAIILLQDRSNTRHGFCSERHVDTPPDNGHSISSVRTERPACGFYPSSASDNAVACRPRKNVGTGRLADFALPDRDRDREGLAAASVRQTGSPSHPRYQSGGDGCVVTRPRVSQCGFRFPLSHGPDHGGSAVPERPGMSRQPPGRWPSGRNEAVAVPGSSTSGLSPCPIQHVGPVTSQNVNHASPGEE
jgi:hypothetical protein